MESPRTIDKYELVEKLGEGGFGVVYKARHLVTKLPVAIKILVTRTDAHPDVATRFRREASIGNEIDHENIVRALDFGYVSGQPYLVLEFLDGVGVDEAVRTHGPMAPHRVARIALQVADALAAAHGHGVIHRDLKPENIFLVRRSGRDDFVKVLDFGIAKLTSGASQDGLATRSQTLIGSPVTMSPEQCRGADIDSRSDVYALGIVIFFALTGRYPFFGAQADILSMHLRDRPPRVDSVRPGVPASLVALVERALAKDPAERFQTMGELARALAPLTADPALVATPQERPTVQMQARRVNTRWPTMVAVAAAGAAVALAGGGIWRLARGSATGAAAATAVGGSATSGAMTSETTAGTDEAAARAATTTASDARAVTAAATAPTGDAKTGGDGRADTAVDGTTTTAAAVARNPANATGNPANAPGSPANATGNPANAAGHSANATGYRANATDRPANATGHPANATGASAPAAGDSAPSVVAGAAPASHGDKAAEAGAHAPSAARPDEPAADARNGYLTVAVLPFAEVVVDGHVAGTTPLRNLPLRPGAHSVEISNVGLHRHTRRNQRIDAGAHHRIQLDWSN